MAFSGVTAPFQDWAVEPLTFLEIYTLVKNAQGLYEIPENRSGRLTNGPFKLTLSHSVLVNAGNSIPFFTAKITDWSRNGKSVLHFDGENEVFRENTLVLWNDRSKAYTDISSGNNFVHTSHSEHERFSVTVDSKTKKFTMEITNAASADTPSRIDLCFQVQKG